MKSFEDYFQLREETNADNPEKKSGNGSLNAKVTLGADNDYEPFVVSDDPNSQHYGKNRNLAPVIRAFKKGGNWGWSKDDKTGEDKPVKISGKKLYLTGGAVRDHLAGKTPRNIELSTNASPDEVYHILSQNEFKLTDDEKTKGDKTFSVKTKDSSGRPFSFNVYVGDDVYELETFTKTPKGGTATELEPGTHSDDAGSRDFTINSMSILLSNDNGENKELNDFYGGMHHLANSKIQTIGNMEDSFTKDPKRMLRFGRMVSGYGDASKISDEEKETIKKLAHLISQLDPEDVMDDFNKGINKDDCDPRKHLQIFGDLGLLSSIFPEKSIDESFPKELTELGDKNMALAWMLRHNHPAELTTIGMGPDDSKISFLVRTLNLGLGLDENMLDQATSNFIRSGIPSKKLKKWLTVMGKVDESTVDAFIAHMTSPRVKVYVMKDDGSEDINENFKDLFDPFTNEPVNLQLLDNRKRELEYQNYQKHLKFFKPE